MAPVALKCIHPSIALTKDADREPTCRIINLLFVCLFFWCGFRWICMVNDGVLLVWSVAFHYCSSKATIINPQILSC